MSLKEKIFNDLISSSNLDEEIECKKDIFLNNLNQVKLLLKSGLSTKKQIERYSKDIDLISRSSYEKYCKEFLKKEYEEGLLFTLFFRNIKTIAFYISEEKNPSSKELYLKLLEAGSLKKARNDKNSSLDYPTFLNLLKNFLKEKNYEDIIFYDELEQIDKKRDIKEENIIKTEEKNEKIKIELVDNNIESCDLEFIKSNFIEYENSYIDNNIKEKNVYYIEARYIDKEYNFKKFKELILNEKYLEDYSIIIHNNSAIDTKLYIYRLIDNQLFLIKELDAISCVFELDELIRRGRKNFFEKFESHIEYLTRD
ncbi:hypothetical protein [Halarcobacter bivalviorum]|uniref:hypothetical protein n=1 Tax=Halarcobacter bivalviorum TaxID=663364 RepID=UPI00100C1A8B|nr:hypothetical protein [Halarcobacter bivalviorum]RXK07900.1 hypothetical protein CRU97_00725 [Halarcobacter bivalviorum]